jgi:tetratricopeptide (TPR) repeat protein
VLSSRLRAFVALLFVTLAVSSFAIPRILIVQTKVGFRGSEDPNLAVANYIAGEMDELAKLEAVVWSLTDPILRAATTAGKISYKETISQAEADAIAKKLGAEYLLIAQARRDAGSYRGKVELFRSGKSIWKDEQNLAVKSESSSDTDSSLRSLARSLVLRMNSEAFKGLPSQKATVTPALTEGQAPVQVAVPRPTQPVKKDNGPLLRNVESLIGSQKTANAIALLRDAVDSDPLDVELRLALGNALLNIDPSTAAMEARNAAGVLPESAELRVLAARAWMRAGKPDEAQTDLNEAMARNPDGSVTRILLGEIGVAQLKPERSLDHLNQAIKAEDSSYARFLRAFAYALAGSADAMKADLDQVAKFEPKPTPAEIQRRYDFAADVLDRSIQLDSNAVRALVQRAIVKPNDKEVLDAVDLARRQIRSRGTFAESLGVPTAFKRVQEQRLLAYKLMAQSLTDLLGYMAGGGDESLTDSRINLGEAIRNASEARAAELRVRG